VQASLEASHLFIRLIDHDRYSRDDTMGSAVLSCAGLLLSSGEPVAGGVPFELPIVCCGVKAGTLYGRLHAERKDYSVRDTLRRGNYFNLLPSNGLLLAARRSARSSRRQSAAPGEVSDEDSFRRSPGDSAAQAERRKSC